MCILAHLLRNLSIRLSIRIHLCVYPCIRPRDKSGNMDADVDSGGNLYLITTQNLDSVEESNDPLLLDTVFSRNNIHQRS